MKVITVMQKRWKVLWLSCVDLSNDKIKELQGKALAQAIRWGYSQDAEDFAQDVLIKTLTGRKATIEQLFIDYLRQHYGDSRSSQFELKRAARFARTDEEGGKENLDFVADSRGFETSASEQFDDFAVSGLLTAGERETYERLAAEERPFEIAAAMGVSQSRISQIRKNLRKKHENMAILETLDEYRLYARKSQFEVDWIVL